MIIMKLKNILACALGAGLLTVAAGSAQALVIDNNVITVLKAQLTIKWTDGNGNIQKARISSKDMVDAISGDFVADFSGDLIVFDPGSDDYWLMDRNDVLEEDLSLDQVILADYNSLSSNQKNGSNFQYKRSDTGTIDFEFYSDGGFDSPDSTLSFTDAAVPYTYTETGSGKNNSGNQTITINEKDRVGADGHDFDVVELNDLPINGTMTQTGHGMVNTD
jgi:hypothetical protein